MSPLLLELEHCLKRLQPSGEQASLRWVTVGGRTSAYVAQVQKHPNGPVASRGKKGGVSWSIQHLDEEDDYEEPESESMPIADEATAAETTKRKLEVSTG